MPLPTARPASGSFLGPSTTISSSGPTWKGISPPHRGVEVLHLVHRQRVDAAGEVLPAVVGHDEDDVALVELAGDPHRHRRDGPGRNAGEDALVVEQLAGPDDRVAVGDEDLAVQDRDV